MDLESSYEILIHHRYFDLQIFDYETTALLKFFKFCTEIHFVPSILAEKQWLQRSQKINAKLKFLHRQSRNLTTVYKRLLCNVLIQPPFDYGCSSWFPVLKRNLKLKFQRVKNKCNYFCLHPRSHIDPSHPRKIKLLPASNRVEYCIANTVFKYQNGIVPGHIR